MNKSRASNMKQLSGNIYKLTFKTDDCSFTGPGQYAVIKIGNICRPYQVCDYDSKRFSIVFRSDDEGGRELSQLEPGAEVETITGLGSGFDVDGIPDNSVLAADSMGIPEMLELARCLLTRGKRFKAVLGYRTKEEIYLVDSFRSICSELEVLTLDGSNGREGTVSDVIRSASYVCAGGSPEMLRSLAAKTDDGQFSLSELMQMMPDEETNYDLSVDEITRRCMKEGPVFDKNTIDWEKLKDVRLSKSAY